MRNPEEATEKLLAALRDTEAPSGLDHRILLALEQAAVAPPPSPWRRLSASFSAARPALAGIALASLAAIALLVPALHRDTQASTPISTASLPPPAPVLGTQSDANNEIKSAAPPHPGHIEPSRTAGRLNPSNRIDASTATAAREMQAASLSAPPLPLTQQEKLLLRIVRQGAPEQRDMLNPELRLQQEEQSKAEFKDFFEPPETKGNQ